MDINNITAVYFVGAGGIGMSALIRYFLSKGKKVGVKRIRSCQDNVMGENKCDN